MPRQAFDLHFVVQQTETEPHGLVRVAFPVTIAVLDDAKPYADVDLAPNWAHEGGIGVRYHVHAGKFYSWPFKDRLDIASIAAVLDWRTEPRNGINGHPFSTIRWGDAEFHRITDNLFPPDWISTRSYGSNPRMPHAARARIYGGTYLLSAKTPKNMVRPPLLPPGAAMPQEAHEIGRIVQDTIDKHFAIIDGKLVRHVIEPYVQLRIAGGASSAAFLEAFDNRNMHAEQILNAAYSLADLEEARAAAYRLSARFGERVNDRTSFRVHAPKETRISYRAELWETARNSLPKLIVKNAHLLEDDAIILVGPLGNLARDHDRLHPDDPQAMDEALFEKWIMAWRVFQKAFGDHRNSRTTTITSFKRLHVTNEFIRCVLDPDTPPPAVGKRPSERKDETGNILSLTQEYLGRGGLVFADAWLRLRRSTTEAEVSDAASTMINHIADFSSDAARRRWQESVREQVRIFAKLPKSPEPPNALALTMNHLARHIIEDSPPASDDSSILLAHFDRQLDRVMLTALEAGWPLDKVNAMLLESARTRTINEQD